jgi:hypothetical protein
VELSEALKQLVERVVGCEILPQTRQEIIEDLAFVGQQASLRPEQRKRGVAKAVLAYQAHNANGSATDRNLAHLRPYD